MTEPDPPFIRIVVASNGALRAAGATTCTLGHRLAPSAHGSDGIFAAWSFDGARFVVETDRYGMHPVYVATLSDGIAVSPSIAQLLSAGASRDLDFDALAVLLHVGFFLGEETPFRAIRALPPGGRLVWTRTGTTLTGGAVVTPPTSLARAAALDAYVESFRAAMRRRPPHGRVALPLSGGRDSRHMLFELVAAGTPPEVALTARHFPWRPDEDAEVAPQVAAAVGVPHVLLPQSDEPAAETWKNHMTGFCADEHAWLRVVADALRPYDTVYDGIGGEVLSNGAHLTAARVDAFATGRYADVATTFLFPRTAATIARVVVPELRDRLSAEHARTRVAAALAAQTSAANPIGAFIFWNRTRREIALVPWGLYPRTCTVYAPYLDHAVYDLLAALPLHHFLDHAFHTDAIARAFPAHAALPYERGDVWPPTRPHDRRFTAEWLASGSARDAGRGLLLMPGLAGRVRRADRWDGWRNERQQLQPRLALYLAELEALAIG